MGLRMEAAMTLMNSTVTMINPLWSTSLKENLSTLHPIQRVLSPADQPLPQSPLRKSLSCQRSEPSKTSTKPSKSHKFKESREMKAVALISSLRMPRLASSWTMTTKAATSSSQKPRSSRRSERRRGRSRSARPSERGRSRSSSASSSLL